jgi:hypothetical protein
MRGDVKRKNLSPLPWDGEAVWLASSPDIDCSEGGAVGVPWYGPVTFLTD